MADEIHLDDVGTEFILTVKDAGVAVNIGSASTKQIIFEKPDGTILTKIGTLVTDGSDGKMKYASIAGDLNMIGPWRLQAYVVLPTGSWRSDIAEFTVFPNL